MPRHAEAVALWVGRRRTLVIEHALLSDAVQ
jgi:hypothetical protein